MIHTGNYSRHQEIDDNPEKPFLKDLNDDLIKIDYHFNTSQAKRIKKMMIEKILKTL
tara:strand:- start:123 stop:293 length:171 start_codon:yes stop_codon:yes gene_type:complete